MQKSDTMPIWVYLAFSSISTRKGAVSLIGACIVFSLYCVPWASIFAGRDWIERVFLIKNWSWFAMMIPVIFWYWISLRWVDKHSGWAGNVQEKS